MSNTSKITATIITRMIKAFRFIGEPFPAPYPIRTRPRQSTAYSWLLSFKDEVARQNGSSYARDSPGSPAALTPKNESPRLVRRSADAGDRFEGLA